MLAAAPWTSRIIAFVLIPALGCGNALLFTEGTEGDGGITLLDSATDMPSVDLGVTPDSSLPDGSTPDGSVADASPDMPGPPDMGTTLGLAGGVTLTGIAAFQTVKVDLVEGGAMAPQNAPIIAGRPIRFRAYVSGASSGNVTGVLTITNGGSSMEFTDSGRVSGASADSNAGSLFEFDVPAAQITPTTQLSVGIHEAGGTGANSARFPRDGSTLPLGARTNGGLDVVVVPIQYGGDGSGRVPDTGASAMEALRAHLRALFPVATVNLRVRAPSPYNSRVSRTGFGEWAQALNHVLSVRESDMAPNHEYYLGLINPGDTFRSYCGGGCVAGIAPLNTRNLGSQRGGIALGYAEEGSRFSGIHEFGHTFGVSHAPCGGADGPDPSFPYSGGTIGVWGFDERAGTFHSPDTRDMMGYCDPKWLSDYNFDKLHDRILAVSGSGSASLETIATSPHHMLGLAPFRRPDYAGIVREVSAVETDSDARVYEAEDELGRPLGLVLAHEVTLSMPGTSNLLLPVVEGAHHYIGEHGTFVVPDATR